MAGGLAITQGSSDAWAEMGAQAERALNTGWIFDQRVDGSGGFTCNASPTSSGLTFVSTGDATGFYLTGRPVKAVQGTSTGYAFVFSATAGGGITTVVLERFATEMSTSLSTGAFTNVAVGPTYPGRTGNLAVPYHSSGEMVQGSSAGRPIPIAAGTTGYLMTMQTPGVAGWSAAPDPILPYQKSQLGAATSASMFNTWVTALSMSLTSGHQYDCEGVMTIVNVNGGEHLGARFYNGSAQLASAEHWAAAAGAATALPLSWIVSTTGGAITLEFQGITNGNSTTYITPSTPTFGGGAGVATSMIVKQIV